MEPQIKSGKNWMALKSRDILSGSWLVGTAGSLKPCNFGQRTGESLELHDLETHEVKK